MDLNNSIKLFELDNQLEGLQAITGLNPSLVDNLIFNNASNEVKSIFDKIKEDLTDPAYVGMKGQFPYIDGKYMEDKFDKYFPISKVRYVPPVYVIVQNYQVQVFVEVDAYLTKDIFLTRPGTGGSIIQITREAKQAALEGKRNITPFDVVSVNNAFKSALTNAIANAHSKFKIGADLYKRIILSKEELETIKKEIEYIRSKATPRGKIDIKERYSKCSSAGDKVKLLHSLREEYEITTAEAEPEEELN
jgi:hypothetical protein